MADPITRITRVSSADFSSDLDRYIAEANTSHVAFEIPGHTEDQSVIVLSKQDYTGMIETMYLLSNPVNARVLLQSIDELNATHRSDE